MNRGLLTLLSLLLTITAAHAQPEQGLTGAAAQANLNTLTTGAPVMTPRGTSDGLKGSPYADDHWRLAQITLSNKLPLAPVPLKYDVLEQRLLMRKMPPSRDSLQLDDHLVQQFILLASATTGGLPEKPRTFRRFSDAPMVSDRNTYAEVLHEGRYTLLKRHSKKLKKANYQGAYSIDQRFDEIEDHADYFLRTPDAKIQPLKLSLKTLQAAAPALANELKNATATRKPKTDEDWGAVLDMVDPVAK